MAVTKRKAPKPAKTSTIITALRVLSREIESGDGVANLVMIEAAERMQELSDLLTRALACTTYETSGGVSVWTVSASLARRMKRAAR